MKLTAHIELINITKLDLGTEVANIKLTLEGEELDDGYTKKITFELSSTRISDFRVTTNSHTIKELTILTQWLKFINTRKREKLTNDTILRNFIKEKLDAEKMLNKKLSL